MSDNAYLSNEPFPPELKIRDSLAPTACLPHQEPMAGRGTPTPNGPFGVGVPQVLKVTILDFPMAPRRV